MKKKTYAIVIIAGILGVFYFNKNGEISETVASKPQFKTVQVQRGNLVVKISAIGIVEPNFKIEVKSKASGEILKFPFEEGDFVKKGQLLLRLNKSDEQRNVTKAQADLIMSQARYKNSITNLKLEQTRYTTNLKKAQSLVEANEANLNESKANLIRQQDLFAKKIAPQKSLDSAKTEFKVNQENLVQAKAQLLSAIDAKYDISLRQNDIELAQAQITHSQIALAEVQDRLDETEIFAPINGTLIKKSVEERQIISSGISNISGGTALCVIADMSHLFITADIDETDIGSIKINQIVRVSTDAFPHNSFQGIVKRIAPQGEIESNITIFKVKIEIIGSAKSLLKPMMTANVDIITQQAKDTLFIPREAVNKNNDITFAVSLKNEIPKKRFLKTGIQNLINIQILSGVKLGEELVVGDWEKMQKLKTQKEKKSSSLKKILWFLRSK